MKPITCLVGATVAVALTACQKPIPMDAQVDCADWNTEAFFEAAEVSDVTRCLQADADLNVRDEYGATPLHLAAFYSAEAVTALLEAGADLEARNEFGGTPLHGARTAEAVMALLEAGADLNVRDNDGGTPLHSTAIGEYAESVTALLEAGADPNTRKNSGNTPLHYAMRIPGQTGH